jgi:hypothetical protein
MADAEVTEVWRDGPSERIVQLPNAFTGKVGFKRQRYGVYGGPYPGTPKWHPTEGPTHADLESARQAKEPVPHDVDFRLMVPPDQDEPEA